MKSLKTFGFLVCLAVIGLGLCLSGDAYASGRKFKVAWSHYTGWEPWEYARNSGILKKWADRMGIEIELSEPMDYAESVNLFSAGQFDACVMTNMDQLTGPAAGGVDSTALIIGDFSNGNDAVVARSKEKLTLASLRGKKVKLVENTVSHYLLARALNSAGMKESDVTTVNVSDSDIAAVAEKDASSVVVTWNPMLMQIRQFGGAQMLFDSSRIPGEILDLMVVRTDAPESLKKALTGAWYETLDIMTTPGGKKSQAIEYMAKFSGATRAEFEAQLQTTALYTADATLRLAESGKLRETMEFVRTFCFDHGLLGQGAKSADRVGVQMPDGTILGDKGNVKMRFDVTFMKLAAEGKL